MFDRFRARKPFRYSRWDGSQRLDDLDAEGILDALSDDYMRHGDLRRALERMMREGFTGSDGQRRMGLQDLMERLRQMRDQRMQRYNMNGVMDDIKERLEQIKQLEREGIQRRLDSQLGQQQSGQPQDGQQGESGEQGAEGQQSQSQGQAGQSGQPGGQPQLPEGMDPEALKRVLENLAKKKLDFLDQLPPEPAGQIEQLSDYDFMDAQAREQFQELLQMLQQQVMQSYFQGMQQAIQNMSPEDLARMREMVRELNQMLRDRADGKEPDFDSFMQKYGDYFGPGINTLDDLIEQMQRQQAAMQAVMDSMSPEQRAQLQQMVEQLIGDDRLRVDLAELAMNLEAATPGAGERRTRFRLTGDEPLSLAEAKGLMGMLQEMDELESQLHDARRSGEIEGLDPEKMRDLVGDEEAQALEQIQRMMRELEEEGLVRRNGDRYELTSKGIRRIGQKALEDIFAQLQKDAFGAHRLAERGYGGERDDETKPYAFGDPFHLHLGKTLMNGVVREGAGTPIKLERDDFEVYRSEHTTRSATVLMLDMSWSMLQNDLWNPAKKVAIALESLIRGQFPRDELHIVGFSNFAKEYKAEELIELGAWDHVQGTNMVHGLMIARKLLAKARGANKQIIMITDGGPTVWQEGGRWVFDWPPPPEAILQTLREVKRCAHDGVLMNVFMLWDDPYLKHFVNQMANVNRGRAFYTNPDSLGEYLLVDYLGNKQKRVS
jgi:uncharacterized protein with von Willebrand factor type A (vWA) domain